MTSPALDRVLKGALCAGCGGCAAICPSKVRMRVTGDGFHRPRLLGELTPDEDRQIAEVCPGLGLELDPEPESGNSHTLWGPLVEVRCGHATDQALRHHASSGGALSALLCHLLESEAVEFILHNAAAADRPLANVTVLSRDRHAVYLAAGSRYAPSSPLENIDRHLADGARFAFVGKPCDVAALRRIARHDPRVDYCIPYMFSFFCAGVPSLRGGEEIVRALGLRPEEVLAFRYRGDGWPGRAAATLQGGDQRSMGYDESWGGILTHHVQFRCRICPDGTGGFADVVCADAWHRDASGQPLFEEADGLSLIVSRTSKGEELVARALHSGSIRAWPVPVADIESMQPGQTQRKQSVWWHLLWLRILGRPSPRYRRFHLTRAACGAGIRKNLMNAASACRRVLEQSPISRPS